MFSLERLFYYADIDDVTEEDEFTELVFTMRGANRPEGVTIIKGENLDDCLDQAERQVLRYLTLESIRREGLTDEDIDRLADADDAWQRGYVAGATEAAELVTQRALVAPAVGAPAMAAAAEPMDNLIQSAIADPEAWEKLTSGDGIGITLALIHPAKIVLA